MARRNGDLHTDHLQYHSSPSLRGTEFIQTLVFFQTKHFMQDSKTGNFYTFVISSNQSCISQI